jgi:ribosome-binding protein aMBF1 (putative translation factor)
MNKHCDVCGREEPVVKTVNIYRGKVFVCQECGEAIAAAFAKKRNGKRNNRKTVIHELSGDNEKL